MKGTTPARQGGWGLVTGASSGLGVCFAESLARRGFPVVLTARRADRLEELATRLRTAHGVEVLVVPLDLTDDGAHEALVEAIGEREIGLLVVNAGFGYSGRFEDHDVESDVRMVRLNCESPVRLVHAFLPSMLTRDRGGIVIVSSVAGFQPTPWFALYGATKAFDLMLAESLWVELRGSAVDVIGLCPGETRTEFAEMAHMGRKSGGMEPGPVVDAALDGLGGGPSVVTGALNKMTAGLQRFLPRSWTARATGAVLAKELLASSSAALRAGRESLESRESSGE